MRTSYDKQDAHMTRGMAILCMLILHLFCRTGDSVYGTPLLWVNSTTPVVYWFGFFAEICVTIYSLCVGYAQEVMAENGKSTWRSNLRRIGKIMINYWIIVVIFSGIGLVIHAEGIPGTLTDFLKSIVLLHSYNGAWWYLHSYVFLLLIPPIITLFPVKKLPVWLGLLGCLFLQVGWYFVTKFNILPAGPGIPFVDLVWGEVKNLMSILPAVWAGAFLCKGKAVQRIGTWMNSRFSKRLGNGLLLITLILLFAFYNIAHKVVLVGITATITFLLFNLWDKSKWMEKIFLFLGKHSTNIWLTHMFFYVCLFEGLVQKAKYPLFILLFMLLLCIVSSYGIMGVEKGISFGSQIIKMRIRKENKNDG